MAKRIAARITGIAGYVPPRVLSNADLEKMVETTDAWIRERTGIAERHIAEKGVAASDLAVVAAQKVLQQTNTSPEDIDLIVTATVTPDMLFPATSCRIQHRLGASRAWGFDLSAACSGFLYALTVGAQFAGAGTHRKVLVIGSDVMSSIIDYKGSEHVRAFRRRRRRRARGSLAEADGPCILDFHHDIDGTGGEYLFMPGGGSLHPPTHETVNENMHVVHQAGSQVFKYAVRRMSEVACQPLCSRMDIPLGIWRWWVPHQANLRIIQAMQERLGLDSSKVMVNIERFGNTTAGTIPLGLCDAVAQGRLRKGDLVLLLAVGAGFTTGGMLLRWAY